VAQPAQLAPSSAQGAGPRAGPPVQTRAAAAAAREGAGGGAGDAAGGAPDSPDSEGAGAGPGDGEGADAAATPAQSLQLENARLRSELAEQVRRRSRPPSQRAGAFQVTLDGSLN
jgi:hypothetical protein